MKIFIIGASGFIGSNLALHLSKYSVGYFRRYYNNVKIQLERYQPDWVINCAAEIYNKDNMWTANVELLRDTLEWVRSNKKSKLIHLGSSSEYGVYDRPTKETDLTLATDVYGVTKSIGTQLCKLYASEYGVDVTVIRPYSPYGPGEASTRLFPKLWQSFKHKRPMTLVQGVHDFCHIDDFVRAVEIIMLSNKRIAGDVVNVSSGVQSTNKEVYEYFKNVFGTNGSVTEVADFCTPKVWQANISYVCDQYGWIPEISLKDGIEKFINKAVYE